MDDPLAAARLVLRIMDGVEHLADHPHLGRPGRVPDTRELAIPGTPYRVRTGGLEILRVLHSAMRWPDAL
jgi:plasmid stabilization system protein ParE